MSSVSPAIDKSAEGSREWQIRAAVATGALLLCLGFVFKDFFASQFDWAVRKPADWGHTLLVPLMAFYLAWLNRAKIAAARKATWVGLVPVVAGVAIYVLCWLGPAAINNHTLRGWSVGITVFGLVLLHFGWRAMRWLIFPVAYCFAFGVTIGDRIMLPVTYRLQDLAAQAAFYIFKVLQFDVMLDGNTLKLWESGNEHALNVAEACSGMRMLVAFLALGVFMAATMLSRNWQRIALVILAVPVAVFVNVLRVVTLGLLSTVNVDFAEGDFHTFIGLLWLIPAFLIYLGLMWILRRVIVEDDEGAAVRTARGTAAKKGPSPSPEPYGARAIRVTVVACAALLVSGLGFRVAVHALNAHLRKESVPLRRELSLIARRLGAWERVGEDTTFSETVVEELGTDDYLSRVYVRPGEPRDAHLYLHIAYYTDQIDAVPHVPERCNSAQGRMPIGAAQHIPLSIDLSESYAEIDEWGNAVLNRRGGPYHLIEARDSITNQPFEVRLPLGEPTLRVFMFNEPTTGGVQIVGYFFIANGWWTARAEDIRLLAFDLTDEYAYYCKVEFSMLASSSVELDAFVEQVTDLARPLLPEVMRCLPDWAEVEQGKYPARVTSLDG